MGDVFRRVGQLTAKLADANRTDKGVLDGRELQRWADGALAEAGSTEDRALQRFAMHMVLDQFDGQLDDAARSVATERLGYRAEALDETGVAALGGLDACAAFWKQQISEACGRDGTAWVEPEDVSLSFGPDGHVVATLANVHDNNQAAVAATLRQRLGPLASRLALAFVACTDADPERVADKAAVRQRIFERATQLRAEHPGLSAAKLLKLALIPDAVLTGGTEMIPNDNGSFEGGTSAMTFAEKAALLDLLEAPPFNTAECRRTALRYVTDIQVGTGDLHLPKAQGERLANQALADHGIQGTVTFVPSLGEGEGLRYTMAIQASGNVDYAKVARAFPFGPTLGFELTVDGVPIERPDSAR